MKKQTIDILKNFATINNSILIKKGSKLETVSGEKNILASVTVDDVFPVEHAIYSLSEFLSVLSLLNNPELEYGNNAVSLRSGKTVVKYVYSSPAAIQSAPDIDLSVKDSDLLVSFDLASEQLAQVIKASSVMQLPDLSISEKRLTVFNKKNKTGSDYHLIPESLHGSSGSSLGVSVSLLKMLPGNYSVRVSQKVIEFRSKDIPTLVYFVAVESD